MTSQGVVVLMDPPLNRPPLVKLSGSVKTAKQYAAPTGVLAGRIKIRKNLDKVLLLPRALSLDGWSLQNI